jgi:hypothetical protein
MVPYGERDVTRPQILFRARRHPVVEEKLRDPRYRRGWHTAVQAEREPTSLMARNIKLAESTLEDRGHVSGMSGATITGFTGRLPLLAPSILTGDTSFT